MTLYADGKDVHKEVLLQRHVIPYRRYLPDEYVPTPRICNAAQVAARFGHSPGWFYFHRRRLELITIEYKLPISRGT